MTISSWLNFGHPALPGRGSAAGRKFLAPPYYNQCVVFASPLSAFSFNWPFSNVCSRWGRVPWRPPEEPLGSGEGRVCTGRMPFLSSNQRCQNMQCIMNYLLGMVQTESLSMIWITGSPLFFPLSGVFSLLSALLDVRYHCLVSVQLMYTVAERKGGESSWSGPWHLVCTLEVFHVHSYQDQFIKPGWAEWFCVSTLGSYFVYSFGFLWFVCVTPFFYVSLGSWVISLNSSWR